MYSEGGRWSLLLQLSFLPRFSRPRRHAESRDEKSDGRLERALVVASKRVGCLLGRLSSGVPRSFFFSVPLPKNAPSSLFF